MNSAFQEAVSAVSRNVQLTHKQQVTRLYRRALRTLDSWVIDREIFCDEADKLRAEFDANRSLSPTSGSVVRLMREANEKLHKYTHPDPYTNPFMPGGSRFMRNAPIPYDAVFIEGVPEEVDVAPQDIHYIQVPMSAQPEGMKTVIVDSYKKNDE